MNPTIVERASGFITFAELQWDRTVDPSDWIRQLYHLAMKQKQNQCWQMSILAPYSISQNVVFNCFSIKSTLCVLRNYGPQIFPRERATSHVYTSSNTAKYLPGLGRQTCISELQLFSCITVLVSSLVTTINSTFQQDFDDQILLFKNKIHWGRGGEGWYSKSIYCMTHWEFGGHKQITG